MALTDAFVASLLGWTIVNGGFGQPGPVPIPTVVFAEMPRPEIAGLYDRETMTVRLELECQDRFTSRCRSILVHELVHHLYAITGRPRRCHQDEEKTAYLIQYKWLLENFPAGLGEVALDPISFMLATECVENY